MTRGLEREDLIAAAEIIAADTTNDDAALAGRLVAAGFAEASAHRLVAFLAEALVRPMLQGLGVTHFAKMASVPEADGSSFDVRLADQPEYMAAVALGEEHLLVGAMDHELYKKLISSTSQLDVVNQALNAGHDLKGSNIAFALISPCHAPYVVRRRRWLQRLVGAFGR